MQRAEWDSGLHTEISRKIGQRSEEYADKNLLLINCVASLVTFSGGSWDHSDVGVRSTGSERGPER